VITVPPASEAVPAPTRLLEVAPRLGPAELPGLLGFLETVLADDAAGQGAAAKERAEVARYYLSDTAPGAAIKAFVEACGQMIDLADASAGGGAGAEAGRGADGEPQAPTVPPRDAALSDSRKDEPAKRPEAGKP
jgi:hypothetical protein